MRQLLGEESARAGMGAWAHFLPADTPMPLAMRSLSLIMLASNIEGLPLVFFEAMAMGVPVVSTNLEGIPELVDDEVGACVPNAQNDEERSGLLCDAALRILENDELRSAMGRRARQRIQEHFSFKKSEADYLAAFDDLFNSLRAPHLELVAGTS
jgi:glycosyltransferase involved in cell wall biosynthesis